MDTAGFYWSLSPCSIPHSLIAFPVFRLIVVLKIFLFPRPCYTNLKKVLGYFHPSIGNLAPPVFCSIEFQICHCLCGSGLLIQPLSFSFSRTYRSLFAMTISIFSLIRFVFFCLDGDSTPSFRIHSLRECFNSFFSESQERPLKILGILSKFKLRTRPPGFTVTSWVVSSALPPLPFLDQGPLGNAFLRLHFRSDGHTRRPPFCVSRSFLPTVEPRLPWFGGLFLSVSSCFPLCFFFGESPFQGSFPSFPSFLNSR